MKKYTVFNFLTIAAFLLLMSLAPCCKKLIAVPTPASQTDNTKAFSNDSIATDVMLGVYGSIMNSPRALLNGGSSIFGGLSADELFRTVPSADEDAFFQYALTSVNTLCSSLYTTAYNWLYDCNNLLENLAQKNGVTDSTQKQLTGEAKFLRALIYFHLVNDFGEVPLILGTDYQSNSLAARSASDLVYEQIIADLTAAQNLLSPAYAGTNPLYAEARTRPNQAAASALLARVFLYRGRWTEAETAASTVINNTDYVLERDLNSVFLADSRETIWQLQPIRNNAYTTEGSFFIPAGGIGARPTYALQNWLLDAFEPSDLRKSHWVGTSTTGNKYSYPYKYKAANASVPNPEYNIVLRLAEQYLIRAEARAWLGDNTGAMADLNVIRSRAGLAAAPLASGTTLLNTIWHERQVELFAEWGHRWLDLKRTGQADSVLHAEKSGWTTPAALYPLPFTELTRDPNLTQNAGY